MIFTIFGLLTIIKTSNCLLYEIFEDFNNKLIQSLNKNWSCENSLYNLSATNIYRCSNDIEFIKLNNKNTQCHIIQQTIQNLLPHYQVQVYVDIYPHGSLDQIHNDNIKIIIDQTTTVDQFYNPLQDNPIGKSIKCNYIEDYNYQQRKTQFIELAHTNDQLNLKLESNTNENSDNEQYLFRNVQIFVNQCYKTCKRCVNDQIDGCTTCYNSILINQTFCLPCITRGNEKFLLIPIGCVSECPTCYSYDFDYVCYKNKKLMLCNNASQYNQNSQTISYDTCDLESSAIKLRFRFTFTYNFMNLFQVKLGTYIVAIMRNSSLIAQFNSKAIILEQQDNRFRVEISTPINLQKERIDIISDQSIVISDMVIEYLVCEEYCQKCKDEENCQVCNNQRYMFEGKCVEVCPDYTYTFDQNCYNFNQSLYYYDNLKMQYVLREFYDLSTGNSRIKELFKLDQSSTILNQYNFQKGQDIFFSYLPNKRIFGGPFVWVNAKFQFRLKLPNHKQIIILKFELYQGDHQINRNQFHYQINNLKEQKIILLQNDNVMDDQNWNSTYKTQKTLLYQPLFYEESNNNFLNIYYHCDNEYFKNNYAFCAISNFFIVSLTCQIQSKLDFNKFNSNENPCVFCGDGQKAPDEECDDGNLHPFDGCFNCLFQCNEQCMICIKGLCLECNNGYYLNEINNSCETECGDSIIQGNEQCDDGNLNNYDGCSYCSLIDYQQCDLEQDILNQSCSVCHFGTCLKCLDGFFLENGICISFCGDGIINKQMEECDNLDEVGCINCKIQNGYVCTQISFSICKTCSDNCVLCQPLNSYDVVCKSCQQGYYPVNHQCLQCDSNCLTCQNKSNLCTSCFRADCEECETTPGLYADLKIKQCTSKCGDGIAIQYYEQCDDGNTENGDGCDQYCSIEFSYQDYQNLQIWSLAKENTYDLQLNNNSYNLILLCNTSDIVINGFQKDQFNYNFTIINETCRFEFSFLKSIYQYNTILITLQIQVIQGRSLFEESKINNITFKIYPKEQIIQSDQQKQQAEQIILVQQQFGLIFLILIPISIITNLFDYLWAVLEILSWVNNFYFLNVNYPFNVEILLLNSDWSSIINFPTYQELNQPNCDYYFSAPKKFQDKGIDPLFFNNAQIPFMFILSAISLYLINYIFLILFTYLNFFFSKEIKINKKHFSIFNLQAIKKPINTQIKPLDQIQVEKNQFLQNIITILTLSLIQFKNKIKQTITLCLLDITLACMLQITFSNPNSNIIVGINELMAIFAIGLIIFQLYQSFSVLNIHKLLAENIQFKEKYEIYYENVNTDDSFGYYYNFVGLLRKIIYVFFLVLYYYIPILQTLFCFLSTSIGFFLLCFKNPYNTKQQYILQLILDFNLTFIHIIIVIFSIRDHLKIQFIQDNVVILGWIVISLILFSILLEVCTLIQGLFKYFYNILNILRNIGKKENQLKVDKIIEQQNVEQKQKQISNKEIYINRNQPDNHIIEQRISFIPI